MNRSKVVKAEPKEKIKKNKEGGEEEERALVVQEEEGEGEVEQGDDLDLVPAPEPPSIELVLSSNSPEDNRAPRPEEKVF